MGTTMFQIEFQNTSLRLFGILKTVTMKNLLPLPRVIPFQATKNLAVQLLNIGAIQPKQRIYTIFTDY